MALFDWLFGRSPEAPQQNQPLLAAPAKAAPSIVQTPARPNFSHADRVPAGSFRFMGSDAGGGRIVR